MKLSHRAMQPGDIAECVDIYASHPVVGPRYGSTIKLLPEAWLRLLDREAKVAVVVYEDAGHRAPICFPGVTVFVNDDFMREIKAPPHFWVGPELTRRIASGESPALTSKELREANSNGGLNLVCWESCIHPKYELLGEVQRYLMSVFIEEHRGYLCKEAISSQSFRADHLEFILKTGGYFWDHLAGGYTSTLRSDPGEIISKPHIVGITRELERKKHGEWAGSWVGCLFDYHPPILGFARNEQRLLSCALGGATDEQIAEMLVIPLHAVKKLWVSIYLRVERYLPELASDAISSEIPAAGRGREKRRRLLAYLRDHLEELRPYSPRLLRKSAQAEKIKPVSRSIGA